MNDNDKEIENPKPPSSENMNENEDNLQEPTRVPLPDVGEDSPYKNLSAVPPSPETLIREALDITTEEQPTGNISDFLNEALSKLRINLPDNFPNREKILGMISSNVDALKSLSPSGSPIGDIVRATKSLVEDIVLLSECPENVAEVLVKKFKLDIAYLETLKAFKQFQNQLKGSNDELNDLHRAYSDVTTKYYKLKQQNEFLTASGGQQPQQVTIDVKSYAPKQRSVLRLPYASIGILCALIFLASFFALREMMMKAQIKAVSAASLGLVGKVDEAQIKTLEILGQVKKTVSESGKGREKALEGGGNSTTARLRLLQHYAISSDASQQHLSMIFSYQIANMEALMSVRRILLHQKLNADQLCPVDKPTKAAKDLESNYVELVIQSWISEQSGELMKKTKDDIARIIEDKGLSKEEKSEQIDKLIDPSNSDTMKNIKGMAFLSEMTRTYIDHHTRLKLVEIPNPDGGLHTMYFQREQKNDKPISKDDNPIPADKAVTDDDWNKALNTEDFSNLHGKILTKDQYAQLISHFENLIKTLPKELLLKQDRFAQWEDFSDIFAYILKGSEYLSSLLHGWGVNTKDKNGQTPYNNRSNILMKEHSAASNEIDLFIKRSLSKFFGTSGKEKKNDTKNLNLIKEARQELEKKLKDQRKALEKLQKAVKKLEEGQDPISDALGKLLKGVYEKTNESPNK